MFEYKEIVTNRTTLNDNIRWYQLFGWEIVSHAICPNNNISILIRKEQNNG